MIFYGDDEEPVTVTIGDLIIFSVSEKNSKLYFNLSFFKSFYLEELERLNTSKIEIENIEMMMSQIFKRPGADLNKFRVDDKDDYETIILRVFPEKVKVRRISIIDHKVLKKLPSEKLEEEKSKKTREGGVITVRIPDSDGWIIDLLERDSIEKFGRKNISFKVLDILREHYKPYSPVE